MRPSQGLEAGSIPARRILFSMKNKKTILNLERTLGIIITGAALIGIANETYVKNFRVREYARKITSYGLLPFIAIDQIRRLKKYNND